MFCTAISIPKWIICQHADVNYTRYLIEKPYDPDFCPEKRWITHGRAILGGNQTSHHQRGITASTPPPPHHGPSFPFSSWQKKSPGAEVMSSDGVHINIQKPSTNLGPYMAT